MIISIDIGTSYSTLCFLNSEGKAEPVEISTGVSVYGDKFSLPSAVFVDDEGKIHVGQAAMKKRALKPQNFRMEFKRNLGQSFPIVLGDKSFLPEDLYAELFRHMLACFDNKFNQPIEKAYITYPASFGAAKQEKIVKAANDAGIFNTELISEPSAAAMCYGASGNLKSGIYMVYDFGGGTFDTALVQYEKGNITQIGTPMGIEHCGGSDIDRLIYDDIKNIVPDEVREQLSGNKTTQLRFEAQLAEMAVEIKHQLTFSETAEEVIPAGFDSIEYTLTREKLNSIIAGMIEQTVDCCRNLLSTNKKSVNDLSGILLVGGTSRIPLVRDMLKKLAGDTCIYAGADLELSVARGAVCWHEKDIKKSKKNILMKDVLSGRDDARVFGSSFLRKDIRTITFLDTLEDMPENAWDVSENKDASVFAWVDGFDLYVGAEGKIYAGADCTELFADYFNLKEIEFNNCFDTSLVTNMSSMFSSCQAEKLDLRSFDTSSVTNMINMFSECRAKRLDLSSFDTSSVTDMSFMFWDCEARSLDLSSFNTSSVRDMSCMFNGCTAYIVKNF